jgi:hypothetical protein
MCRTKDAKNEEYFFNFDSGESVWEHPIDTKCKALYQELTNKQNATQ